MHKQETDIQVMLNAEYLQTDVIPGRCIPLAHLSDQEILVEASNYRDQIFELIYPLTQVSRIENNLYTMSEGIVKSNLNILCFTLALTLARMNESLLANMGREEYWIVIAFWFLLILYFNLYKHGAWTSLEEDAQEHILDIRYILNYYYHDITQELEALPEEK